jgi:hypothetical protein
MEQLVEAFLMFVGGMIALLIIIIKIQKDDEKDKDSFQPKNRSNRKSVQSDYERRGRHLRRFNGRWKVFY